MSESPHENANEMEMDFNSKTNLTEPKQEGRRWTSREKCLGFVLFFCAVAVVLLVLILVLGVYGLVHIFPSSLTSQTTLPPRAASLYCMTQECIKSADAILSNINVSVDPCEDFFRFSCDGWLKKNPIPDSQSSWNNFNLFDKKIKSKNKEILQKPSERNSSESFERKVKLLYLSCMDTNAIDRVGAKPLLEAISKAGGWKTIGTWDQSNWSLRDSVTTLLYDYFVQSFVGISMKADDKSPDVNIIMINQKRLGMRDREYYFENETESKFIKGYKTYMTTLAELLGATKENATDFANEVFDFERELANISFPSDAPENLDPSLRYNKITVEDLHSLLPQINWTQILATIDVEVDRRTAVIVFNKEYMTKLSALIDRTDSSILSQYLVWALVQKHAVTLSKEFEKARDEFRRTFYGAGPKERWEKCVTYVGNMMGDGLSSLYIRKHFSKESKEEIIDMIKDILQVYEERIDQLTFMDDPTKKNAKAKLEAIQYKKIGFPDFMLNDTHMDLRYRQYEIKCSDCHFQNKIDAFRGARAYQQEEFKKPVDKEKWFLKPIDVNAYYSSKHNEMVFLAGILQPPFYAPYFTRAMKYASIGMIVGHEITHAFDKRGSQYDKDGKLQNWWTNESRKAYEEATECFSTYFSKYEVSGFQVNGELTVTENTADTVGLRVGYAAYKTWVSRNGPEKMLPGVNRTPEELFFIANSALWCGHTRLERLKLSILSSVHAPLAVRGQGPASQTQGFAETYKCGLGSPMTPAKICKIF
ncbi:endothelin-converting enzyme 2 [Lingula anatina]|uniref:Endothelin-converting enzyme 2 n=1 Tax=Lingula anatina TaxID=7574 RepID=A0A1S3J7I8_LINAN|nr:endothelin-converting enzyme 2 [Lingula anatina]|eukprot:XP_013406377.1 endothelin-converting enzyme 2 [Lingula anatina]